jgi:undecaprenyl-diphosphatase
LPISSSGHVVIVAELLAPGDTGPLDVGDVNIVLHVGTLVSILVFYWRRIVRLLTEDRRTIGLLIVGTLPGVALGGPVKKYWSGVLENPLLAGALLIVSGLILLWVSRRRHGEQDYQTIRYATAFWIGVAQAAAILPGLSRSGATISAGLALGMGRRAAATFSFLLAIPIIAGGGIVEILSMVGDPQAISTPPLYLAVGAAVAFAVGLVSIWWLVRWLERGRLAWFAWWCIPVGLAVVVWQLQAGLR